MRSTPSRSGLRIAKASSKRVQPSYSSGAAASATGAVLPSLFGTKAASEAAGTVPCPVSRARLLAAGFDDAAHGINDAAIACAPAEIAGQLDPDAGLVGIRQPLHDIACGNQHAGRAEAALQRVLARKCLAQVRHDRIVVRSFDGVDRGPVAGDRVGQARARRRAAISTVQAPHTPCSQPRCVPVSRQCSRRKSARWVRGSTSALCPAIHGECDRHHREDLLQGARGDGCRHATLNRIEIARRFRDRPRHRVCRCG